MTTNEDLAARVAALEDRMALIELEGQYARTYDRRDGAAWAALFTPDGIYRAREATPQKGQYVQGAAALADFCTNAPFDGIHFLHLPQLTIEGDTATARVHMEFAGWWHGVGAPVLRMCGYYDVRYVKRHGRWLIEHRVTSTMSRQTETAWPYPQGSAFDA